MRPPPEAWRMENPELFNWLNDLWSYVMLSVPLVRKENLADDAYIDLPDSVQGFGFVFAGDFAEWAFFTNTAAGVVTFLTSTATEVGDHGTHTHVLNSANAVNTDTDAKLCIFDNGTNVRVRNRLGAAKEVLVIYYYYP